MNILDDASLLNMADPGDMLGMTASFADQLEVAMDVPAKLAGEVPGRILLGGMGGSAVAGRLLAPLLDASFGLRLLNVDGYELPKTLPGDLLLLSSYSGQTEEVLELFGQGEALGLRRMVLTAGGDLQRLAESEGLPCLSLPPGYPPRAALPSALGRLLGLFDAWGLTIEIESLFADLRDACRSCDPAIPRSKNPAKSMAATLGDFRPAAVALSPVYAGAARRLQAQFEENAERSAHAYSLPELHHNSWIPWMNDEDPPGAIIWLGAAEAHPRVLERKRLSEELLSDRGIPFMDLPSPGQGRLNRLLTSVLIGDFVSVYLALLRGMDPSSTDPLDAMKARLNR
ncbi:hypothetical protein H8E52_09880 [bacterium]|nr:hypothetical protein [bacterium]